MTDAEDTQFVNVKMPTTLTRKLEAMAKADDLDRSKLIRKLVLKEWRKREKRKEVDYKIALPR